MHPNWTPFATYIDEWNERRPRSAPSFALVNAGPPLPELADASVRQHLEEFLDTAVALQRAEWLEEGLYLGPSTWPDTYATVLDAARVLGVAIPPSVVTGITGRAQTVAGTDDRPFLHLSSFFLRAATPAESRFAIGRLLGHIATDQVTWTTLFALLVDHDGLRRVARRSIGPSLEVFLAPLSLGARLLLARWHRLAEVQADRAGLLIAGDLEAAQSAMLRETLGVAPDLATRDYLRAGSTARSGDSPSRWAELLATRPFLHKRMKALELFAQSETYTELRGEGEPTLSREEADRKTRDLLRVMA